MITYASKFWPEPTDPPRCKLELDVEPVEDGTFSYQCMVYFIDDTNFGVGGSLEAKDQDEAEHKAMFKFVTLLGELLATETTKPPRKLR